MTIIASAPEAAYHAFSAGAGTEAGAARRALRLYQASALAGRLKGLWAAVAGTCRRLLALPARGHSARNGHYAGLRTVPLERVRGSEGRAGDFDRDFHPLRPSGRDRWLRLAAAHLSGAPLPPIQLLQVGADYYVRDGHHRVSIARALGQEFIEAEIVLQA
jgi:hypothetical protein